MVINEPRTQMWKSRRRAAGVYIVRCTEKYQTINEAAGWKRSIEIQSYIVDERQYTDSAYGIFDQFEIDFSPSKQSDRARSIFLFYIFFYFQHRKCFDDLKKCYVELFK